MLAMQKIKSTRKERSGVMPTLRITVDVSAVTKISCVLDDDCLRGCPFGYTYAGHVQSYFDGLEWDFTHAPVSLLEFYIDFSLHTSPVAPIYLAKRHAGNHKVGYYLPDMSMIADVQQGTLKQQALVWQRVLNGS